MRFPFNVTKTPLNMTIWINKVEGLKMWIKSFYCEELPLVSLVVFSGNTLQLWVSDVFKTYRAHA